MTEEEIIAYGDETVQVVSYSRFAKALALSVAIGAIGLHFCDFGHLAGIAVLLLSRHFVVIDMPKKDVPRLPTRAVAPGERATTY